MFLLYRTQKKLQRRIFYQNETNLKYVQQEQQYRVEEGMGDKYKTLLIRQKKITSELSDRESDVRSLTL